MWWWRRIAALAFAMRAILRARTSAASDFRRTVRCDIWRQGSRLAAVRALDRGDAGADVVGVGRPVGDREPHPGDAAPDRGRGVAHAAVEHAADHGAGVRVVI